MRYDMMPDEIHKTILDVNLHALWGNGYRVLLVDVDNTLAQWNDLSVPESTVNWVQRVKKLGFSLVLFSNNGEKRVRPVAEELDAPYLTNARKPSASAVKKALKLINADKKQAVLIGDQLLTDMWAGKRAKVYTVLVRPISEKEMIFTRINRKIEKALLARMGVERV